MLERKRRHGPRPKPDDEARVHGVSCRLTHDELAELDRRRGKVRRGEWLRLAALSAPPRIVPEVNKVAWADLAKASSNLNQLARAVNEGRLTTSDAVGASALLLSMRASIESVRASLIGDDNESQG